SEHVFFEDLSISNFINSDFAMLNNTLAKHYGIKNVNGSHFRPVRLTNDSSRGGVLTQGSILLMGSDGAESNPIYRGVWLRKRLFADPPPPPPPGAPPLEKKDNTKLSLKEQIALHREEAACARCHDKIDPWGIAFEAYDPTGRIKSTSFDSSTILPDGSKLEDLRGLQEYIQKSMPFEFAEGFTRRVTGYALGRQLEYSDDELVKKLTQQLIANDLHPSNLIENIVTSSAFLSK
ncbi:MAG: DUF1588 domain-containing protein, partial [Opitutae bacterium]